MPRAALFVVFLLILVSCESKQVDLYEVLGVTRYTDSEGVKASYKKLARQWHPDKHDDKEHANEMMKLLNEAKEVLSDDSKRAQYDRMMQKMESIQSFTPTDLPTPVLIYFTCPVYISFRYNSVLGSFLCTAMWLGHVPILVACYLFYKYAFWGPVPLAERRKMIQYTYPVRLMMLIILTLWCLLFMVSFVDYAINLAIWVVIPVVSLMISDNTFCVHSIKEKKFIGPAGSPKMVEKISHKRPDWLPWWGSWIDICAALSAKMAELDNHPVIVTEYRRNYELQLHYRACDVEAMKKAEDEEESKKNKKSNLAAQKRALETEKRKQREQELEEARKSSEIKAVSSVVKGAPKSEEAPTVRKVAEPKRGEHSNVVDTGSSTWTKADQTAFEKALKKAPRGVSNRWELIAAAVPGKTPKQCAARYKELASLRSTLSTSK
eukprot:TRINITY_DN11248_c0_g1_i1.p1 TRINITY_DN11248_c0_g1~~TRINITY_DN11248_c0_g1_i1.p1  ORF type:complete len:436 (+),score=61.43 TRINITY_DN11248_c0_g1_i1:39-1346(+)